MPGPNRFHPDSTTTTVRSAQFADSAGNFRGKASSTVTGALYLSADTGTLICIPPNADPGVTGALWNNGGTAAFSA